MDSKGYTCCCKGGCGGESSASGLNRREFIKTAAVAAGAASFLVGKSGAATPDLTEWNASLLDQQERRIYRGDELKHIAMPLGGFGAGQVYLRGDGTLNPWQIVNNFNTNANVPGSFFAVRAKTADGSTTCRLLQSEAAGGAEPVASIDFSGEYPFAWVRYNDEMLPVDVELEAFSPFIPLNTKDSGLPAVLFRFNLRNRTEQPIEASLLASTPNLVGWDGYGGIEDLRHVDLGGNVNAIETRNNAAVLAMRSQEGDGHRLERPARLYTNHRDIAHAMRHCGNLQVFHGEPAPLPKETAPDDVFFVADRRGSLSPTVLSNLLDRVEAGASLVLTNDDQSLLAHLGRDEGDDTTEVFEDWESGTYGDWTIEGNCFGDAPVTGTQPNQQTVSGWQGTYFVNTFNGTDGTQGRATSHTFTIERRFIHLLVGGGNHPGETCVNLVVDGSIVETATGENTEKLRQITWDVQAHAGKQAQIEIVDRHTGGWGHILVDRIVFSDSARADSMDKALAKRFREALPFRFLRVRPADAPQPVRMEGPVVNGIQTASVNAEGFLNFRLDWLKRGAERLLETEDGTPLVVSGSYGNGKLIVCNGLPDRWMDGSDRKTILGNLAALATGNAYQPMTGYSSDAILYGTMALALLGDDGEMSACPQWSDFGSLWEAFANGTMAPALDGPSTPGSSCSGAIATTHTLQPGEEKIVTVALAWHFPNRTRDENYGWGPPRYQYDHRLGNQYNNWFGSADEVVDYIAANLLRLAEETHTFHTTFYNSTLPRYYLDCVTANASIMRSPIYVWLEDGTVGGFEGSDRCCPMNCTHVYNYAMSTAFFLPALERNVRETDLLVQMHPEEHYIPHRTVLPLSLPRLGFEIGGPHHPALDGELGTVLKTYREYRQQGDRAWLASVWERTKTLMRYIMRYHDPEGTGVIRGEQPNTYDTHLYGSNTFIGTLYLAALRAAEEMAKVMNEADTAQEFRARFELGRDGYDQTCWNGEYYENIFDAPGADDATYNNGNCYGQGCHTDQLLGQWWAFVLDLGYVLPEQHVKQALKAIHQHCWRADLSDHAHHQRVFAEGTEKGLLTCTWPKGGRLERPILYCDEVWTGLEYHVAASLIHEGMVQEGLQIVRGARERYTGSQRNPWSEIECGGHYARAMSSYSLMTAAAGLVYDAATGSLSFSPRITPENYKGFFTGGAGWGTVAQRRTGRSQRNSIDIRYGEVLLSTVTVECPDNLSGNRVRVTLKGEPVRATARFDGGRCEVRFSDSVKLSPVGELRLEVG
ncbi:MAG: twin-arginine translocation signal domain-containing protein [Candidatus Hydrogenedentes bacterium]|nr:twin-arginine translocation signal domain-containing protein [Candidatus Hydrogenedentota bacterium]